MEQWGPDDDVVPQTKGEKGEGHQGVSRRRTGEKLGGTYQ